MAKKPVKRAAKKPSKRAVAADRARDKRAGVRENSARDQKMDRGRPY